MRIINWFRVVQVLTFVFMLVAAVAAMCGCQGPFIAVDKSVHVDVHSAPMSMTNVDTRATNTSDTKADGNTASAEAGLTIPLVP